MKYLKTVSILVLSLIVMSLIIAGVIFLLNSCSNPQVYKSGYKCSFTIHKSDKKIVDTLHFVVLDKIWMYTQKEINYKYIIHRNDGSKSVIMPRTGVIDRQGNFITRLFIQPEIWLHPPRQDYLRKAELVPFPWIKLPVHIGQKMDWELTPGKGWEEFEGKEVTGVIEVVDKIYYDNPVIQDTCWVINTYGKSEIGEFTGEYYFSEKYGFVRYFYDFNEYKVEIMPYYIHIPGKH